jgi:hypothetical protein
MPTGVCLPCDRVHGLDHEPAVPRETVRLLLIAVLAVSLWIGGSLAAGAQSSALPTDRPAHTLGEALRSRRPPWRGARFESVASPAASHRSGGEESISDRQPLALADFSPAFWSQFTRPGRSPNPLVQTARFASRLMNAPNYALCRLTGADRARLDLRKRRVSFTWFVSW